MTKSKTAAHPKTATGRFRAIAGLDWTAPSGDPIRVEPSEEFDGSLLTEKSSKWLLRDGHIERVGDSDDAAVVDVTGGDSASASDSRADVTEGTDD